MTGTDRNNSRWKRLMRRAILFTPLLLFATIVAFVVLDAAFPFPKDRLDGELASPVVRDRHGNVLFSKTANDEQWRFPIPLERMGPYAIDALLAAEDQRFFYHPGIDPIAVARAVEQNLASGQIVSGASTLTMQVCRMMDDRPRTWEAKAIESFRAVQLERDRSKREIIESYLNEAPFGGNLRGIEAAARRYYDRSTSRLTLGEVALLVGLPQAPSRFRPDRHPDAARTRRDYVLSRMKVTGAIDATQFENAVAEPVRLAIARRGDRDDLPTAQHVAAEALRRRPHGGTLTIDSAIQAAVEEIVARHTPRLPAQSHVAVVAIDVEAAAIRAWVGSSDFNRPHDGQNDGVIALRSPGSALKPFVYAAAFDARRLEPSTVVPDGDLQLADWSPDNFDRKSHGELTAADALRRSLNIPAIAIAQKIGIARCAGIMQAAGIRLPDNAVARAGLSLATGGTEVRLLDLTNAYATIAREGLRQTPRLFEDEPPTDAVRAIDATTCIALDDVLSSRARAPAGLEDRPPDLRPWFMWKTGTSSARRDAWAVGHNGKFAVGVWVGRFDGAPHPRFVGREVAEPIVTEIFATSLFRNEPTAHRSPSWHVSAPLFEKERTSVSLEMTQPAPGSVFIATGSTAIVHARTNNEGDVSWFLDGTFVDKTRTARVRASVGAHALTCVDENGASQSHTFFVKR